MRKIVQAISFATVVGVGLLSHSGIAQEVLSKARVYEGELHLTPFLVHSSSSNSAEKEAVSPDRVSPTPDAPAPPLTYIATYNTCGELTSTSTPYCEYDVNATTTTNHFPTTSYKIYEVVRTHGDGSLPIVKLGGSTGFQVPNSAEVETDLLCTSSYTACTNGQTVTGYDYWYDLTSLLDAGYPRQVYVQSTSNVSPINTYSASITIMQ
jgi:hypothetical protein